MRAHNDGLQMGEEGRAWVKDGPEAVVVNSIASTRGSTRGNNDTCFTRQFAPRFGAF